jgi:hypothetical protein
MHSSPPQRATDHYASGLDTTPPTVISTSPALAQPPSPNNDGDGDL